MYTCLLNHVLDNVTSVPLFATIRLCSNVGEIVALARSFTEDFHHGVMQRWEEVDKEAVPDFGWEKVAQFPDAAAEDMPPCLQVLPRRHPVLPCRGLALGRIYHCIYSINMPNVPESNSIIVWSSNRNCSADNVQSRHVPHHSTVHIPSALVRIVRQLVSIAVEDEEAKLIFGKCIGEGIAYCNSLFERCYTNGIGKSGWYQGPFGD
jgi:hypothetical protein